MAEREEPERKRRKSGPERMSDYRERNPDLVKLSKEKEKLETLKKRANSENFDEEVKKKERERKQAYRAKKALEKELDDKENMTENDMETPQSQLNTKNCQLLAGLLSRRKTNRDKNEVIDDLFDNNKELETENEKINISLTETEYENLALKIENRKKDKEIADLKRQVAENDMWFKIDYKYLSSVGKREFRAAHKLGSTEHPPGTDYRLRKNTGINFSKTISVDNNEKSELKKLIEKFAVENSSESPDMRNEKKGIRYRNKYFVALYDDFRHENPDILVSSSVFISYWPKHILKPKPGDYSLCCCEKCENPALKIRALKRHKLIEHNHNLDTVLREAREENFELEESLKDDIKTILEEPKASQQITYMEWKKVQSTEVNKNTGKQKQATTQRVPTVTTGQDLAVKTLADFEDLKEHLERNHVIKNKVLEKREEVMKSDDKVMLQNDWAENMTIITPNEAQSAFYGGRGNVSLHTGYEYSKRRSGGFVSLSDENNHKAEAIVAALDPKIKELVEEGFKEIIIVSDSPVSQYRNGKMAYLASRWAVKYGIRINWLFTEAGHGKSAADGIGGNIKNKAQEKQNMEPDIVIKTAKDVIENIETSIEMKIHTKEDIQKVTDSMPSKIGALVGATKIHELVFESDGQIKMKKLPNEAFYKQIRIKTGVAITRKQKENVVPNHFMEETAGDDNVEESKSDEEEDVETEDRRRRMRTRRRLTTIDNVVAGLEDDFVSECESDDE